jgi:hypothetical protein
MKRIIAFFMIITAQSGMGAARSVYGSYGLISRPPLDQQSIDFAIGSVIPWNEDFNFLVEYGFLQSVKRGASWCGILQVGDETVCQVSLQEKNRLRLHQFFIGASKEMGLGMVVWGGLAYGHKTGDYILDHRHASDERFRYKGDSLFTQSGISSRWRFDSKLQFGIDWLVFGIRLYDHFDNNGKKSFFNDERRRLISATFGHMVDIKQLRFHLSYELD